MSAEVVAAMAFLQSSAASIGPRIILLPGEVFLLLFVTLGPPLKTPALYQHATEGISPSSARSLAFKASAIALVTLLIGGFLGGSIAQNWHVSIPILTLAGGVIFLLVSLKAVLRQFDTLPIARAATDLPPSAFSIAVPMMVTPYGLAALIILLANSTSTSRTLTILAMLALVLVAHLLGMLAARPIMKFIGPLPLQLLGVIMSVLTVALSLQVTLGAFHQLGLVPTVSP